MDQDISQTVLNKEVKIQTGLNPAPKRAPKPGEIIVDDDDGAFVGGRYCTREELERVDEILYGILDYCASKQAGQIGSKGRKRNLKDQAKEGDGDDIQEDRVNPLTAHQTMRQEITHYWNRFSMIQIESRSKKAKMITEKPVMSQTQQEGQKKMREKLQKREDRKDNKNDMTDQDLMLHDLQKEIYAEEKKETSGIDKELRCINAKQKVVTIKMTVCKQTANNKDLIKLNNWEKKITSDMSVEEREVIIEHNKKISEQKKSYNPAIFLKTLVSQKKNRL